MPHNPKPRRLDATHEQSAGPIPGMVMTQVETAASEPMSDERRSEIMRHTAKRLNPDKPQWYHAAVVRAVKEARPLVDVLVEDDESQRERIAALEAALESARDEILRMLAAYQPNMLAGERLSRPILQQIRSVLAVPAGAQTSEDGGTQ